MKEKMKNLLIRLLVYLLDSSKSNDQEDDKQILQWMAWSFTDPGCRKYIEMRERQIIQGLLIDGLAPLPRDSFQRKSGQRFELIAFKLKIEKAHKAAQIKKQQNKG